MKRYIFIAPGSDTSKQMLADLISYESDNFKYFESPINLKNGFVKMIFKYHFKVNKRVNLPFKLIWSRFYPLYSLKYNVEDEYYIILGNGNFNYYSAHWLNRLKKKYNLHYIIYFIDPLSGLTSKYMKKNIFNVDSDMIYTFDYNDSKKMNARHTMNFYSKKKNVKVGKKIRDSVYFVGVNKKNRIEMLHKIWDLLQHNDIRCNFNIVSVPENLKEKKGINYNSPLIYDDVLNDLQNYECILEVLQPGQTGVTLRYYEAIAYNKKLITNNKLIKKLPFYNPDYMYIFEKIDDIDCEWIKKDICVDYGYSNEFSPINFVEQVKKDCN